MNEQSELVRPLWDFDKWHKENSFCKQITAVICERDTADNLKLTVEALLRFYPDINILIVDGGSVDDSVNYARYKSALYPNVKVWERGGRNGHGTMMDEAIRDFIDTPYVLMYDSDVIAMRGGWLEELYDMLVSDSNMYASGTLMLVSYKNEACGPPHDENDVLRYIHPSCGLIKRDIYLTLKPFVEHGAPCCFNMIDAQDRGLRVGYFPIERYVAHLSGASWCVPKTMWRHDYDVLVRPFFTFIADKTTVLSGLTRQTDKDFEVVMASDQPVPDDIVIHFVGYFKPFNDIYALCYYVHGEYICRLKNFEIEFNYIQTAKHILYTNNYPDRIDIGGLQFVKRKVWQLEDTLL